MAKITYEFIKDFVENEEYVLISTEYINAHEKLEMECKENHRCFINWNNFKNGRRCKECAKKKIGDSKRLSYDYVKKYFKDNGYTLLNNTYTTANKKLITLCPNRHIHKTSFNTFQQGHRCSCEAKTKGVKHSFDYVKDYISNNNYELLTTIYNNCYEKLLIKCDKGHIYEGNFHNFKSGFRCPICNRSKGENEIEKYLKERNINFITQYKFDDCRNKNKLPFDFAILNEDDSIKCLIEFDGKQHFEMVEFFGEESYIRTKQNDDIKNKYCETNNIKLIRISYNENIYDILNKQL